jgi:hypothetical protein
MRVEAMTWRHAHAIANRVNAPALSDPAHIRELIAAGPAFACLDDGAPFAIVGLTDAGHGRAAAWCYIAHDARPALVAVSFTRGIRRFLATADYRRIECVTVHGPTQWHAACERFVQRLGFRFEGVAPYWLADGSDALRWFRVRSLA